MQKIFIILVTLSLSGCVWFTPYSPEIPQGNFIEAKHTKLLKKGMSKQQVKYILGTPLLEDPFNHDRWDYIYRIQNKDWTYFYLFQKPDVILEEKRLSIRFVNNQLIGAIGQSVELTDPALITSESQLPVGESTIKMSENNNSELPLVN